MNLHDYLEHLKGKPEHERRRIALASSAGITLVIALSWGASLISSGVLALEGGDLIDSSISTSVEGAGADVSGLAGAAAALEFRTDSNGEVTVVETKASSTLDQADPGDATVIPF